MTNVRRIATEQERIPPMKMTLSIALGACLALALAGAGRAGEVVSDHPSPLDGLVTDAPVEGGTRYLPRFWAEVDYLMVWAKSAPIPPLVTSGPVDALGPNGFPGTLGSGGGVVLGGQNIAFNPASGLRFVLGSWLGNDCCFGVEASYFTVLERSEQRSVSAPGLPGTAPLSVPYFNALLQQESSVGIALPRDFNPIAGNAQLSITTRVQSFEANALCRIYEGPRARLDAIFGYRWIGLDENLFFDT